MDLNGTWFFKGKLIDDDLFFILGFGNSFTDVTLVFLIWILDQSINQLLSQK